MIDLNLQMFGGGGGGSGGGTGAHRQSATKLGNEIYSARGIKKDREYLIITNNGDKTIRTGEQLLRQIDNKSLKYDDEIYHWVSSKGTYIIRQIIRRRK